MGTTHPPDPRGSLRNRCCPPLSRQDKPFPSNRFTKKRRLKVLGIANIALEVLPNAVHAAISSYQVSLDGGLIRENNVMGTSEFDGGPVPPRERIGHCPHERPPPPKCKFGTERSHPHVLTDDTLTSCVGLGWTSLAGMDSRVGAPGL